MIRLLLLLLSPLLLLSSCVTSALAPVRLGLSSPIGIPAPTIFISRSVRYDADGSFNPTKFTK